MTTRRRFLVLLVVLAAFTGSATAHEMRVLVTRPVVQPGMKTVCFLSWGHLLPVDELTNADDLESYDLHKPGGERVRLEASGRSLQEHEIAIERPGVSQIVAARKSASFTTYTDAEGKTRFMRGDKKSATLPSGAKPKSTSRFQAYSKAIVISGKPDPGVKFTPIGHDLELQPVESPGANGYPIGKPVRVRVLRNGLPVPGVTVSAASTTLNPDGGASTKADSGADGVVELELDEPGTWILSASHSQAAPAEMKSYVDEISLTATLAIPVATEK
ncbi:MAG: DUF4198 domain-containing protein [Isosphaeraceae bacterium]|nr:DUF4198 domain-containing protein [Isosphaeraceae bacterium]